MYVALPPSVEIQPVTDLTLIEQHAQL